MSETVLKSHSFMQGGLKLGHFAIWNILFLAAKGLSITCVNVKSLAWDMANIVLFIWYGFCYFDYML